ncbi:MAG: VanW family protein [Patescibacteria group bacterium]
MMPRFFHAQSTAYKAGIVAVVFLCALFVASITYAWYLSDRIVPRTWVGSVAVGGMTREQAAIRIQEALDAFNAQGIVLSVEGSSDVIAPDSIALDLNLSEAIDAAFLRGHKGGALKQTWQRVSALWSSHRRDAPVRIDETALRRQISDIADTTDFERSDIRLQVIAAKVSLLTDTKPGRAIDQSEAFDRIQSSLRGLSAAPIALQLYDDMPRADIAKAKTAVSDVQKMISRSLSLQYEDVQFYINRERLGSWIISEYDGDRLKPGLNREAIGVYVTTIATALNIASQPPQITTQDGRVTGFIPPKVGRSVQEDKLTDNIINAITVRTGTDKIGDTLVVPLKSTKMSLIGLDEDSGITELIGRATTPFTGSPRNRISNIKNGVKFLTGTIVAPGEEFSTLATLGIIDNTTGYLPELVIKGDRTTPEFGGGLCQVSTTLFRSVLDAGLPITARRNHSYRVSYYEKDANGKVIGPGLDATIYQPDTDFRFLNDTTHPILIIGYVIGDKATFELYGTKDGRTSQIIGPKLLTETSPGEPVYIETTDLTPGVIKQVETPHPGGSATATYIVTYSDGTKKTVEFKSWYRRWPAKYLKGVLVLSSPTPTP